MLIAYDLLLIAKDPLFLIGQKRSLIGENLVELLLIRQQAFLIGDDRRLVEEEPIQLVLVGDNAFLIREDRRLVHDHLVELCLVARNPLLIRENPPLVPQDFLLIADDFVIKDRSCHNENSLELALENSPDQDDAMPREKRQGNPPGPREQPAASLPRIALNPTLRRGFLPRVSAD
jgi:hypothetical protein